MVVELELLLGQLGQLICLTPSSLKRTRQEGSKAVEQEYWDAAKPAHAIACIIDVDVERVPLERARFYTIQYRQ